MTLVSSMAMRAGAAVLSGVLALGALVGCEAGGDDEDTAEPTTESSTESSTEETTVEATPGYLPVPEGVMLTDPGTRLGFGDEATVAWRPRQDSVVALDLTVERIDETSFKESFEGWVVTRQMKGQTPYFVHVKATNVSGSDVGGLLVPVYALGGGSSLYEPLDFRDEPFEPCPGGELPARLREGKSADLCLVYLLPEGETLTAAAFDLVGELDPVLWSGAITSIDDGKHKKGKNGKKGKQGEKSDTNG